MEQLDRPLIERALSSLNDRLQQAEVTGEMCIYGGTVMVLAFHARLSTHDLDAVFQPAPIVRAAAAEVAAELQLAPNWLNDGVKGFLSPQGRVVADQLPQYSNLRLTRPTTEYLLAMKCLAARSAGPGSPGDKPDIVFLIRACRLKTAADVLQIIETYYPANLIQPKTRFLIEEIISEEMEGGMAS